MEKLIISSTSSSSSGSELTIDERNLFSTATKKVIDSLCATRQALSSTEQNHNDHFALVTDYKSKIEYELSYLCNRVLTLLDKYLIPSASNSESKVFYLKMKGDYC
ncbi:14-3-3 protein 1 [Camellia lanceoleosa]|uniref:14-3-3 protein 1 n=1 Tax=Camellia lanceoleosa TaxID=1840588 RepID=A0ACC0J1C2_9ERIC|nr:14-3-3 protein 1 [Camellia lanceoleosa]